jgi:flagellar biosynthesis/type III secretory pathway chaperone
MDYSFLPLFTDYKKRTSQLGEGQTSAQAQGKDLETIIKELQSLKNHLQQARQNSLIPQVELNVDPEVKKMVELAKRENRDCKVSEFDELIKDLAFQKRIESNLATWLFDI